RALHFSFAPFLGPPPVVTHAYSLSLHDALPILRRALLLAGGDPLVILQRPIAGALLALTAGIIVWMIGSWLFRLAWRPVRANVRDRESTRLNSSHVNSYYAVFCSQINDRPQVDG